MSHSLRPRRIINQLFIYKQLFIIYIIHVVHCFGFAAYKFTVRLSLIILINLVSSSNKQLSEKALINPLDRQSY